MKNIKLKIEYDGSNYSGWQSQTKYISIQETIEEAIKSITAEDIKLISSGRTDAGVHALEQVANFHTNSLIEGKRFRYAINTKLPEDIIIKSSEEVDIDFHARFNAVKKRYKYIIYNEEIPSPLYRNHACHFKYKLDIDKMIEASKYLIGEHDFKSFMGRKVVTHTTIRRLDSIEITKEGSLIIIHFEGKSFLKQMIRIIAGTLMAIGAGKYEVEYMKEILKSKDRTKAGVTAAPQGLYLEKVFY